MTSGGVLFAVAGLVQMLSIALAVVSDVGKLVLHLELVTVELSVGFALGNLGGSGSNLLGRLGFAEGEGTPRATGGSVGVHSVVRPGGHLRLFNVTHGLPVRLHP